MPSRRRPVGILPNGKRPVPKHHATPLPYGWILSEDVQHRLQFEGIKRALQNLERGDALAPEEEGLLVEAFGRLPEQADATKLLEWVEQELA